MHSLELARELAGLSVEDFWLRYFALGGNASPEEFSAALEGRTRVTDHEYNVAAHALNERYTDLDLDHPVPYA